MKNSKKGSKRILVLISGLLFTTLILNSIAELKPSKVVSIDQGTFVESGVEEVVIDSTETEIKQEIIQESTTTQDSLFATKVDNIKSYLESRNSPLAVYAEEIVKAADKYGIDYRLVASISIVESSGGIRNFKPYNAWGWGKTGFNNWNEGIWAVSKGLGRYYAKGMNTPRRIAPSYCPPNAVNWANNVQYIMNEIGY